MKLQQSLTQKQQQVQKMVLSQQLQQSLQVLHFSTDELMTYLANEALENPLLELSQPEYLGKEVTPTRTTPDETFDYLQQVPDQTLSLFESLIEQVHLNYRKTYLRSLVLFLVEYIDVNGYLTIELAEAAEKTGSTTIQMLDALTLLQQLDPAGVGARSLQECLMLQTERDQYAPHLAYVVLEEEFDLFAQRKWDKIARKFNISLKEVQNVFDYVQTLTPTPGAIYQNINEQLIIPDLKVTVVNGEIQVQSFKAGIPEVRFQQQYFNQLAKSEDPEVLHYIEEKKQAFDHLQKMLHQRGDTIFRIGQAIVARQAAFFLDESRPLQPLRLKDIAERLQLHESTVSRAINGKYLSTTFGVFELKRFFTQKVNDENGEDLSAEQIKKALQILINNENKQKPLSDQKIVTLLAEQEMTVSRRTIAKYRDALNIPSSSKRKRYDA